MEKETKAFFSELKSPRLARVLKQHWKGERYDYRVTPRPDHGLMLVLEGEVLLQTKTGSLRGEVGDVVFLPQSSRYEAVFEGETQDILVNFEMDEEAELVSSPVKLLQRASLSCIDSFYALTEESYFGMCTPFRLSGLFYLLLDRVASEMEGETGREYKTVEETKKLLCGETERSVGEIARQLGISESGLRKEFRAVTGISPTEYRLSYKMERAKYLLESTDLTVGQIADTLHFYDGAYFCKTFRKRIGMTPLEFAKQKKL